MRTFVTFLPSHQDLLAAWHLSRNGPSVYLRGNASHMFMVDVAEPGICLIVRRSVWPSVPVTVADLWLLTLRSAAFQYHLDLAEPSKHRSPSTNRLGAVNLSTMEVALDNSLIHIILKSLLVRLQRKCQ